MNQMMPSGFNFNSQLLVRMDDLYKSQPLRKTMNDLLDTTPMVTMESLYDYYQDSEAMYQRTSLCDMGLCGFIMLFAVINLVNTLIATTLSRKHEFSVLRSVGMAKSSYGRQYSVKAFCWLFEHLYRCPNWNCGRLWNCSLSELCWRRYLVWHFPAVHFVGYMIVAILLPVLIAAALIHLLEKKSVQQLRDRQANRKYPKVEAIHP